MKVYLTRIPVSASALYHCDVIECDLDEADLDRNHWSALVTSVINWYDDSHRNLLSNHHSKADSFAAIALALANQGKPAPNK